VATAGYSPEEWLRLAKIAALTFEEMSLISPALVSEDFPNVCDVAARIIRHSLAAPSGSIDAMCERVQADNADPVLWIPVAIEPVD
jgi:hypothetical protein